MTRDPRSYVPVAEAAAVVGGVSIEGNPGVKCPDCHVGWIEPLGVCSACSLSWEALEDAAAFLRKT
jgi:hypothetical protein